MNVEKLFEWFQHILGLLNSGESFTKYARENNLPLKEFKNFSNRLFHKNFTNPKDYERSIFHRERFVRSNLTNMDYCKANGIDKYYLHNINNHFSIWKRVEIELIKRGIDPTQFEINPYNRVEDRELSMNFIRVKKHKIETSANSVPIKQIQPIPYEQQEEYIKAKNDLEISISHGIKVLLPHDTDSEKMLKVINFLKEL